jgi:hypothetical protein
MFEYFPKIQYNFNGITQTVTNIFKSVNITIDNQDNISTTTAISGERPDQLSSRLYDRPDYFWSLFLTNGIRNPLREWSQTKDSYTLQIEKEYDGWYYQFANTSNYLPGVTAYQDISKIDPYQGVDLTGISVGDLIIYETGTGPFSIKCLGAGGVTSSADCGSPQFGQSLIPDNFNRQQDIVQVSAGDYFTACLDSRGYIYAWGKTPALSSADFIQNDRLYSSKTGRYTFIAATGENLIAVLDGSLVCFGGCTAFNTNYSGQTGIVKTSWTSRGISGGVGIKSDGTVVNFGLSGPTGVTLNNIACGYEFCVGVLGNTRGVTVWGDNSYNQKSIPGITGVTAIAAGFGHALAVTDSGNAYGWGLNTDGQTTIPSSGYVSVSAGSKHSAGLKTDGSLEVWGNITTYSQNSGCEGISQTVSATGLTGSFSRIYSGKDHIVLKGSGTNYKYTGVVKLVDPVYKRIFVKAYQFTQEISILLDDPSGTIVSFWSVNSNGTYRQNKSIQHQLLTIEKYLDSTLYIEEQGLILDPTEGTNWQSIYLANHQNSNTNEFFITPRKQLLNIDFYNKAQINHLNVDQVNLLKGKISNLLLTNDIVNIKTSEII